MAPSLPREYEICPLAGGDTPQVLDQGGFTHSVSLFRATPVVYSKRQMPSRIQAGNVGNMTTTAVDGLCRDLLPGERDGRNRLQGYEARLRSSSAS